MLTLLRPSYIKKTRKIEYLDPVVVTLLQTLKPNLRRFAQFNENNQFESISGSGFFNLLKKDQNCCTLNERT